MKLSTRSRSFRSYPKKIVNEAGVLLKMKLNVKEPNDL